MDKYKEGLKLLKENKVEEAMKAFEESIDNVNSKYQLGLLYITKGEITKGIKLLEEAAVKDNLDASKTLVTIYSKGVGVAVNHDKASVYAKEIVKNNVEGAKELVKEILNEQKDNKPVYLKYLQALCEINDLEAIAEASDILFTDANDPKRAIDYLVKGANLGSKYCMEKLALIYKEGLYGTKANEKGYVEIIKKLADQYPEEVSYTDQVVALYEFGLYGVTKDYDIAVNIYRERASHKFSEAIYEFRLAEAQEVGRLGIKKDVKEALKTYQALLDSFPNNPLYQMKMAEILDEGKYGVNKDSKKAAQIYRSLLAKNPDDVNCIIHMAKCYANSVDAEEQKQAYELFNQAFDKGLREAGYYVVKYNYEGGKKFPKNYKKAVDAAAKLTNEIGTAQLDSKEADQFRTIKSLEVQMYESGGPMLPKNPKKAKEVLNEYNNSHKEKIKIDKVMWGTKR